MVMTIEFKQVEPRVKLSQNIIYLQFFTFSGKMRSFFFFLSFCFQKDANQHLVIKDFSLQMTSNDGTGGLKRT